MIHTKDPDATLDYHVDWSAWLADGETIDTAAWTVAEGITEASTSATDTVATVWLSGGTDGQTYAATCRVTTTDGRIDDRTITIRVRER